MKLAVREIATLTFRRPLPAFLAGGEEEAFLEIEARAGGSVNPAYVAGVEQLQIKARVLDRKVGRVEEDEAWVRANHDAKLQVARERFAILHDACVISWRTNMLDDGKPMQTTRANFLALADVRGVPELTAAFLAFEAECLAAGKALLEETQAVVKN